jgi:DNA polymerase III subunit delta'
MPTIRSRCQPWQLPKPAPTAVIAWLQSHAQAKGLNADDAALLLSAAGGSPWGALALLALGWQAAMWRQLPQALQDGNLEAVHKWPLADVVQVPVSLTRLTAWEQELRTVRRQADHPWNAALKVQAMALRAQQALQTSLH